MALNTDTRQLLRDLEPHIKRGGTFDDDPALQVVGKAVRSAYEQGQRDAAAEADQRAEQAWRREQWDGGLDKRVGLVLAVVGEQIPMPVLLRAVDIAPAVEQPPAPWDRDAGANLDVPAWAEDLANKLRNGDPNRAHSTLKDLRKQRDTPSASRPVYTRRGHSDFDVAAAFVLGGLILG
jgi:hypothetical protein